MATSTAAVTSETVELVRTLIRNRCVNDGTVTSGQEVRNVDTIRAAFGSPDGVSIDVVESQPGRQSLVVRVHGSDPDAASLCLMSHLDVVPAPTDGWDWDPFAADMDGDVIVGRGAVDMLNQAGAQTVAVRRLLADGFRPRGDLVLFLPADEETSGTWGAQWILANQPELVACDYLITEGGGFHFRPPAAGAEAAIGVMVAEKGITWKRVDVPGTPGHASVNYRSDNAVVTAARCIERLAGYVPPAEVNDVWAAVVDGLDLADDVKAALADPAQVDATINRLADSAPERLSEWAVYWASTHTSIAPNEITGGVKTNVIAPHASFTTDIRTLPGYDDAKVTAMLRDALGELFDAVTVAELTMTPPTASPVDTPLWPVLQAAAESVIGPVRLVPWTAPFATDARFFRQRGTVGYGFTLHDDTVDLATWLQLFHGRNERVSTTALGNAVAVYDAVVRGFLG